MSGIAGTGVRMLLVVIGGLGLSLGLGACGGSTDDLADARSEFSLSGEVHGLGGGSIELSLNDGAQVLAIEEDGAFAFGETLANGSGFAVRVRRQPTDPGLHCRVSGGQGVLLGADVDDIVVRCAGPAPRALSQDRAITLSWQQAGRVDVMYSTDPDCDWANYSVCENSGIVTNVEDGEITLTSDRDQLEVDRRYWLVVESGGRVSVPVAARPYRAALDGDVRALAEADGVVYAGGHFTGQRPHTGAWTTFAAGEGELAAAMPRVDGAVRAAVSDGEGGWYLAGHFSRVGGESRQNLAHVDATGQVTGWSPSVDRAATDLALHRGRVYVSGGFDLANGEARSNLAAFDARAGALLDWGVAPDGTVTTLAVHAGTLYAGGCFSAVGEESRAGLAAFDALNGGLAAWNPGIGPNVGEDEGSCVYTLRAEDGRLYVGGDFTRVGGMRRLHLAALDPDSGQVRDWTPRVSGPVFSIAADGDRIFAGGHFDYFGDEGISGVRAFDAESGDTVAGAPYLNGVVDALAVDSGRIYAGGNFTLADEYFRAHLAAFDRNTGAVLDWQPGVSGRLTFLTVDDGTVLAGGRFQQSGGINRGHLAAFEAASGELLDWAPETDGWVKALAVRNGRVYAGGEFQVSNGEDRPLLAAFEVADGALADWQPALSDPFWSTVHALVTSDERIYAAGQFRVADGDQRDNLAAFDPETGALLDWRPDVDGEIRALTLHEGAVYAGGSFYDLVPSPRLAAFDAVNASRLDGVPTVSGGQVQSLTSGNNGVFVSGYFDAIDGVDQAMLASFTPEDGVREYWRPAVDGFSVRSLLLGDASLYVGGQFTGVNGESRSSLAAFNPQSGELRDWSPALAGRSVYALTAADGVVFVGARRSDASDGSTPLLVAVDAQTGELVWGEDDSTEY